MGFDNFSQNTPSQQGPENQESINTDSAQNQAENTQGSPLGNSQEAKETKPKNSGLLILLIFCGILAVGGVINFFTKPDTPPADPMKNFSFSLMNSNSSQKSHTQVSAAKTNTESIAVIHIEGTIQEANETYNQEWLITTIRDLSSNDKNLGILLYIDSPGGGVYQSDEVYLELLDYKENSGRPVWAYLGPLAASGGYYIASAADHIIANRNCLTGSIGVIAGQSMDFSQFLEKHGVKVTTFIAGSNKDMLGMSVPVTEEQAAIMQSIADDSYDQFVGIVSKSRGLSIEQTITLADGRLYTANQALNNGLIDGIARLEEAYKQYEESLGLEDVEFIHYSPEEQFSFVNYFLGGIHSFVKGAGAVSGTEALLLEAKDQIMPDISYPAYYFQQ